MLKRKFYGYTTTVYLYIQGNPMDTPLWCIDTYKKNPMDTPLWCIDTYKKILWIHHCGVSIHTRKSYGYASMVYRYIKENPMDTSLLFVDQFMFIWNRELSSLGACCRKATYKTN